MVCARGWSTLWFYPFTLCLLMCYRHLVSVAAGTVDSRFTPERRDGSAAVKQTPHDTAAGMLSSASRHQYKAECIEAGSTWQSRKQELCLGDGSDVAVGRVACIHVFTRCRARCDAVHLRVTDCEPRGIICSHSLGIDSRTLRHALRRHKDTIVTALTWACRNASMHCD